MKAYSMPSVDTTLFITLLNGLLAIPQGLDLRKRKNKDFVNSL